MENTPNAVIFIGISLIATVLTIVFAIKYSSSPSQDAEFISPIVENPPAENPQLILCPACKNNVSKEAVTCPSCGHPLKEKKTNTSGCTWLGIVIMTLSGFLFAIFSQYNTYDTPMWLMFFGLSFMFGIFCLAVGAILSALNRS